MSRERRKRLIDCLERLYNVLNSADDPDRLLANSIAWRWQWESMSDEQLLSTWQTIELITDQAMGTDLG